MRRALAESARTPDQLLATARAAEAAGYTTLLIRDHVLEAPFGHQLGPLTALTAVACATTRLRIGTLVFANDFRPPVLLAKELATLDQLSGGRLEIGLGTGFLRGEYDAAGLAFDEPRVKVDRFEEAIQLHKRLLSGQSCTFEGAHYLFGTPAKIVQAMTARREQLGLSYFVISDRQAAEFAPVVALAAGVEPQLV